MRTADPAAPADADGDWGNGLALRVAAASAEIFADGVCFVGLAPLSDCALVAHALASAPGVLEYATESLTVTLQRVLSRGERLVLLDNVKHVIEVTPWCPSCWLRPRG